MIEKMGGKKMQRSKSPSSSINELLKKLKVS
jgi:hypothetical protein